MVLGGGLGGGVGNWLERAVVDVDVQRTSFVAKAEW